jgi:hypothetical protein
VYPKLLLPVKGIKIFKLAHVFFVIFSVKISQTKSLNSRLRNSNWSKFWVFILTINFVNLSANFYEGNIYPSHQVKIEDPIDTITELIFEWALDGSDDLIPDNGTQQDDNSLEKMKLALLEIPDFTLSNPLFFENLENFFSSEKLISGHFSSDSPPPDSC